MMNELHDLCNNLMDDIRELTKKGDISPTELDRAFKAVDIIKDIKTIEAMDEVGSSYSYDNYSNDGYSQRRMYYDEPRSNRSYDADGRYSEARGRDAMGRYTSRDGVSRDGYSGHEEKEHMMKQIEQMKRKIESM